MTAFLRLLAGTVYAEVTGNEWRSSRRGAPSSYGDARSVALLWLNWAESRSAGFAQGAVAA